ncbi:MAG: desulfoferrodoxin [Chloroflexi bacterium]|nr:desulfoferrodoxin [Chloroflexota bacterium]
MANQLGKRFLCEVCGTQVLCTKAGGGAIQCCGKDMELQTPKPLPSSD